MGGLLSWMWNTDTGPHYLTPAEKFKLIVFQHWKGLTGLIIAPLLLLPVVITPGKNYKCLFVYLLMAVWYIVQPIPPFVTGLLPLVVLPLLGVSPTETVASAYYSEWVVMILMSSMILSLICICKLDKRIFSAFLKCSKPSHMTLLLRVCLASACMSMFAQNLLVLSCAITLIRDLLTKMYSVGAIASAPHAEDGSAGKVASIYYMAAGTSAVIGSLAHPISSWVIMAFLSFINRWYRAMPNVLTVLHITAFTLPIAIITFFINFGYYFFLLKRETKEFEAKPQTAIANYLSQKCKDYGDWSMHEKLSLASLSLVLTLTYSAIIGFELPGWGGYVQSGKVADLKDSNYVGVSAVMSGAVVILHSLPSNFSFLKYFTTSDEKELPPIKPIRGIMDWSYTYSITPWYLTFLMGGTHAMLEASKSSNMIKFFSDFADSISAIPLYVTLFLVTLLSSVGGNLLHPVALMAIMLPFIFNLGKAYNVSAILFPMAFSLSSAMTMTFPYFKTPPRILRDEAKVNKSRMVRLGYISAAIGAIVVFIACAGLFRLLWSMEGKESWETALGSSDGVKSVTTPASGGPTTGTTTTTTTETTTTGEKDDRRR